MLSLPNLPAELSLPQKGEDKRFHNELFCETQIDKFTLIPLKTGDNTIDDNDGRLVSKLSEGFCSSALIRDHKNLQSEEERRNKARGTSSFTSGSLYKLNLGNQNEQKPLNRYFASVQKEIFSGPGQQYDNLDLTSIYGAEKITAKNENYIKNELSEVKGEMHSKRNTNGKPTLELLLEPMITRDSCHGNQHRIHQYGDMFRTLLHRTDRQHKEKAKLVHDHEVALQKLQEANNIIESLTEKIHRRRIILKCKEESQRTLEENIESLKKQKDERQEECKKLIIQLNVAIDERENKIEELTKRELKAEASYHQELQNNTELKTKLESKERHIRALKDKVEKARKWKNDIA